MIIYSNSYSINKGISVPFSLNYKPTQPIMNINTLAEIRDLYSIKFKASDRKYTDEIIDIFNGDYWIYLQDPHLYYYIALYYKCTQGDRFTARMFFQKSFDSVGNTEALVRLAEIADTPNDALTYINKAIECGNINAIYALAMRLYGIVLAHETGRVLGDFITKKQHSMYYKIPRVYYMRKYNANTFTYFDMIDDDEMYLLGEAYFTLALIYRDTKKVIYKDSIESCYIRSAIYGHTYIYTALGKMNEKQDNIKRAEKFYKLSAKYYSADAKVYISHMYAKRGDYKKAKVLYLQIISANPASSIQIFNNFVNIAHHVVFSKPELDILIKFGNSSPDNGYTLLQNKHIASENDWRYIMANLNDLTYNWN